MRKFNLIKNAVIGSALALLLVGSASVASAQNNSKEYREWQRAQAESQQRYNDYLRTRKQGDYRQWQRAQQRAQQEQLEYQSWQNRNYNNGYGNNGRYNNNGNHNGWNNPNNPNRYRVYRNGSYYNTDQRGYSLLQQAVRNGYSQGYEQGRRDASSRDRYDYNGNSYYGNGNYGYQSYVDRSQYQYYFREGFQRGYEDGYYSRNQYGQRNGNSFNILSSVLSTILNLAN